MAEWHGVAAFQFGPQGEGRALSLASAINAGLAAAGFVRRGPLADGELHHAHAGVFEEGGSWGVGIFLHDVGDGVPAPWQGERWAQAWKRSEGRRAALAQAAAALPTAAKLLERFQSELDRERSRLRLEGTAKLEAVAADGNAPQPIHVHAHISVPERHVTLAPAIDARSTVDARTTIERGAMTIEPGAVGVDVGVDVATDPKKRIEVHRDSAGRIKSATVEQGT